MQHSKQWNHRTKIICTLGPATSSTLMIERLIRAGMNIARINRSHGTMGEHAGFIQRVRDTARRMGSDVAVLMDLPGPKYRTGKTENPSVLLIKGAIVTLTSRKILGDDTIIPINFPTLSYDVKVGSTILVDDGGMQLKVLEIKDKDVICKIIVGGTLIPGRGVVVPGVRVSEPFLTPQLRENIDFAVEQKPDYIALSFVTNPEEVKQVRDILKGKNSEIPLISKIERGEALKNFDKILAESDGIMVARGDLGVEIPLKEVPMAQKEIILKCNKSGKAVITATQMLESMVNAARPTRAEVTDVANAILDGTDAIMLSAETSIGKYPIQAVKMMFGIARETERHLPYEQILTQRGSWIEHKTDELISYNACYTAYWLNAVAIVAFTQSGSTARRVSKYRPRIPVIAITPNPEVARRLILYWGVHSFTIPDPESIVDLFDKGARIVKDLGIAKAGDSIIITGGFPVGIAGTTNLLKVQEVI